MGPPSVTVIGPSDLRTNPAGLSAASRRIASGLLVITISVVVSPLRLRSPAATACRSPPLGLAGCLCDVSQHPTR